MGPSKHDEQYRELAESSGAWALRKILCLSCVCLLHAFQSCWILRRPSEDCVESSFRLHIRKVCLVRFCCRSFFLKNFSLSLEEEEINFCPDFFSQPRHHCRLYGTWTNFPLKPTILTHSRVLRRPVDIAGRTRSREPGKRPLDSL